MRSYQYKAAVASALLIASSGLAACSSSSGTTNSGAPASTGTAGASGKQVSVAYFNPVATNTYTAATYKGINSVAAQYHATVTEFNANFDATTQLSQMQDAITSGKYDLFIVTPLSSAGLMPVARQAESKGIQVVSLLNPIGTNLDNLQSPVPGVITIGAQLSQNGVNIAKLMIQACGDKDPCKVAYMPGTAAQATDQVRTNALNATLKADTKIHLVAEQPGGFDVGSGLTAAQTILTAHPDLNVIAAASGQPIQGALQAIEKARLTGKIQVVSNGCTVQDIDGVRGGQIFGAPVALPFTEGKLGLQYGAEALSGQKPPTAVNEVNLSPIGPIATSATLKTPAGKTFTGQFSAT